MKKWIISKNAACPYKKEKEVEIVWDSHEGELGKRKDGENESQFVSCQKPNVIEASHCI